ncbi:hypothetical protein PV703_15605 [Streptomyces sp. ME01-24h]|nr:hypothetical protein [Streptomyces sp. ME01-24h]
MNGSIARAARQSRELFWLGFNAGKAAAKTGENTARVLQTLIAKDPAQAAGYLHGIAARREVA